MKSSPRNGVFPKRRPPHLRGGSSPKERWFPNHRPTLGNRIKIIIMDLPVAERRIVPCHFERSSLRAKVGGNEVRGSSFLRMTNFGTLPLMRPSRILMRLPRRLTQPAKRPSRPTGERLPLRGECGPVVGKPPLLALRALRTGTGRAIPWRGHLLTALPHFRRVEFHPDSATIMVRLTACYLASMCGPCFVQNCAASGTRPGSNIPSPNLPSFGR